MQVWGNEAIRVRQREHGVLQVDLEPALELEQLIACGGVGRNPLYGFGQFLQPGRPLLALPVSPEAVEVGLEELEGPAWEHDRWALLRGEAGAGQWRPLQQLYRRATGRNLRSWSQAHGLPGHEEVAMIRLAAWELGGSSAWQLLYDWLCHGPLSPFRTRKQLQDRLHGLRELQPDVWADPHPACLDLMWVDGSRRWCLQRDGDGAWHGVELLRQPEQIHSLQRFDPDSRLLHQPHDHALLRAVQEALQHHPPRGSRWAPLGLSEEQLRQAKLISMNHHFSLPAVHYWVRPLGPHEQVVAGFWPQVGPEQPVCDLFQQVGEGADAEYHFSADYSRRGALVQRAAQLGIRGRTRMSAEELRWAIGAAAAAALPARQLLGQPQGALVRHGAGEQAGQPQQSTLLALESLQAQASDSLLHPGLPPEPWRLHPELLERELFRPLSPFLPASDIGSPREG